MQEKSGVARLIDDHKRQWCSSIFEELLTVWLHSSIEEFGSCNKQLSLQIDQRLHGNRHFFVTFQVISGPSFCILQTADECADKVESVLNVKIAETIQRFNELVECRCLVDFESFDNQDSATKMALEIQGISATLFKQGEWQC
jgi:hypothetical protein